MDNSTRYFQLTPDILLEYNYTGLDIISNQDGDQSNIIDLKDTTAHIVKNGYNGSKIFVFDDEKTRKGFVLPTNKSESRFIEAFNKNDVGVWSKLSNTNELSYRSVNSLYSGGLNDSNSDVIIDNFKIHFTSRNYFGDYDGLIITAHLFDTIRNKIVLFSHLIRTTDEVELNENPMLINQKLYTTYIEFKTISPNGLINVSEKQLPGEDGLRRIMSPSYMLMQNSPFVFSVYGVKGIGEYTQFEFYNVENLNTIYVPIVDKYNKIEIHIDESKNGDYFEVYPIVDSGSKSFSDYITEISNGVPETYMVLHELSLVESYLDNYNRVIEDITHREHYLTNAAQQISEDGESRLVINEFGLDNIMYYRPIVVHSGRIVSFTIKDEMKIINTLDNTTVVKTGSYTYSSANGKNPKKYGRYLNKIYVGEIPTQINVYNKRSNIDDDSINLVNSGSNVTIDNHQYSISGFIESVNIGVSITDKSSENVNN